MSFPNVAEQIYDKPDLIKIVDDVEMYYCHKCKNGMPSSEWSKHIKKQYHKDTKVKPLETQMHKLKPLIP